MKYLLIVATGLLLVACGQTEQQKTPAVHNEQVAEKVDSANFTSIEWIDQHKKFDRITEGQKLEVVFHFKNTGSKPLIISHVQPSCGCTVADPPKEPIAPGEEGEIRGSFDSNGKEGLQHKTLYVQANTKGTQSHELAFEVEVEKRKN